MSRYSLGRKQVTEAVYVAVLLCCLLGNLAHLVSHLYTGSLPSRSFVESCLEDGSARHKQAASTQHQDCLSCQSFQLHAAKPTGFSLRLALNQQDDTPTEKLACAISSLLASTALKRGPPSLLI